jgi:hypothetical protein
MIYATVDGSFATVSSEHVTLEIGVQDDNGVYLLIRNPVTDKGYCVILSHAEAVLALEGIAVSLRDHRETRRANLQ